MERYTIRLDAAGEDTDAVFDCLLTIGLGERESKRLVAEGGEVACDVTAERARAIAGALEKVGAETRTVPTTDPSTGTEEPVADGTGTVDGESPPDKPVADDPDADDPNPVSNGDDADVADDPDTDDRNGDDGPSDPEPADADSAAESDRADAAAVGDDVFHFMTIRPAEPDVSPIALSLSIDRATLTTLATGTDEEKKEAATSVRESDGYVATLADLSSPLATLDDLLVDEAPLESAAGAVEEAFGRSPAAVSEDEFVERDRSRLTESLAARTVLAGTGGEYEVQTRGLRLLALIDHLASGEDGEDETVGEFLRRPVSLPDGIERLKPERRREPEDDRGVPDRVTTLIDDLARTRSAQLELDAIEVPGYRSEADEDEPGNERVEVADTTPVSKPSGGVFSGLLSTITGSIGLDTSDSTPTTPSTPVAGVTPPDVAVRNRSPWTMPDETVQTLSTETRSLLGAAGVETDSERLQLPRASSALEREESRLGTSLYASVLGDGTGSSTAVGGRYYATYDGLIDVPEFAGALPDGFDVYDDFYDFGDDGTGESAEDVDVGAVRPLGVGEMRTVKRQLKRYELGEVAHVENVLEGESKERTHRRATTTEETVLTETETEAESERDLQTAERFELEREAKEAIQEEREAQAGVAVSASYGPTVEVDAYADYSTSSARQASERAAQSYSRSVTERSVERMKERAFESTERFSRRVTEETNEHALENDTPGHVTGVYRYVDKVYEARVLESAEKRLLMEFVVPEPAAFYRRALANDPAEGVRVEKPREPLFVEGLADVADGAEFETVYEDLADGARRLLPTDLDRSNYAYYAAQYGADVSPPPARYAYETATFSEKPEGTNPSYLDETVSVDDGYVATKAAVAVAEKYSTEPGDENRVTSVKVQVGEEYEGDAGRHRYRQPFYGTMDLDDLTGDVPVLVSARNVKGWAASISLFCERTDAAFEAWQLDTYDAIVQAYRERKAQYDEALAAASTRGGISIQGSNPETNRRVERDELKKHAIAMLRGEHVDVDAVEDDGRVDLAESVDVDDLITFFEQAFEWSAMTSVFYPYYWSRREQWPSLLSVEDSDPQFARFLTAGAARVVVPVRPGLSEDVLWYLQQGELWGGDGPPDVTDSRFVPIVQELREQDETPDDYLPVGEPWDVTVPTELVALQDDSAMPDFSPVEWPEAEADD